MKAIKNILGVLAGLAVFAFASCSDEVEYTPAEKPTNAQVFFPTGLASTVNLSKSESSFDVQIMRGTSEGAATYNLTCTDGTGGKLSVPSSVSFASGVSTATLSIGYNAEDFAYDDFSEVTIAVAESDATPYGISAYTFTVGIPAPWISLGMATYVEDCITTFWSTGNLAYQVEIQENQENPGLYRLVNAYGAAYPYNEDGDYDANNDYYIVINAQDPEGVYIELSPTGMNWGYGEISIWSMANFRMVNNGWTLDEAKEAGLCGTLANGIISFPTQTLLLSMADYNSGAFYYANKNGAFRVAFPGYVIADYSAEVAYTGLFTSVDESIWAVGEVTFGEDVESVKVAVASTSDVDATVAGIVDGSIESVELKADGEVKVPMPADAAEGKYALIAVTYGGGEAQEVATATFTYTPANAETWTALGTGTYTYAQFFEGDDEGLTLYKADVTADLYKIEHWGYDVDFKFTFDSESGDIYVKDQAIGYVDSTYGMVYVMDYAEYKGSDTAYSYYDAEENVYYFAVVYYVSTGVVGAGYETYTPDAADASTRAIMSGSKNMKTFKCPMKQNPERAF